MGARQSKRSVDITTTPKKGDGEIIAEGEGKLEKIGDADVKVATNGSVPHNDIGTGEKEENAPAEKDQAAEVKENGLPEEESVKTPNTPDTDTSSTDQLNESAVSEKTADSANESKTEETAEAKKNKEKKKKKWSFRSISFSKKDKSKPSKENKNGEVEEVAEENAEETATSPSAETPKEEVKPIPEAVENSTPAAAEESSTTVEPATEVKAEEPAKKSDEPEPKPEEPKSAPVDEPKVSESVCEKPAESAPSPVKEDVPQVEAPKVVEESITAESKEVRSDDVPPPLPSSNPPSPVTVFAESTKADALNVQEIPLMKSEPVMEALSDSAIASATENKLAAVEEKQEIGDVKSDSILSKSEKTDSELKTVEQKTIDIVSESSDAIMSDNSDAKNLSETLNNVSSIDTSETVVASSETLIKSEETSLEAPISSEAVPELGQPPIEEIPIDIPNPSEVTEKIVPELAQKQESNTDKSSEISKETETIIEPTKDVPEPVVPVAVEKVLEEAPQPIKEVSELAEKPVEQVSEPAEKPLEQISELAEKVVEQVSEPAEKPVEQVSGLAEKPVEQVLEPTEKLVEEVLKPTENPIVDISESSKNISEAVENSSDVVNETSETTQDTTVLLTPEVIKESLESISTLPDISEEASGINDAATGIKAEPPKENVELSENACPLNLPKQLEANEPKNIIETETKPTNEDIIVPQETSSEPLPSSEIPLLEKSESNQLEQPSTPENSPVATNPSETLPPSPPPSPAAPVDSKPQLVEPALPSPDLEPPVINAADSLPDISTESLPSLPEPFSENLAEPMSLPPVDSVPEPIAIDSPTADPPLATECPAPVHSNGEVLTNGNTNGLPSPVIEEVSSAQPKMTEGPLKQVISNDACEVRQDFGDIATESSASPAESTAVAKVEE